MNIKLLSLLAICYFFANLSQGQLLVLENKAKITNDIPVNNAGLLRRSSVPVICGQDTASYPLFKSSGVRALTLRSSSFGQYFETPQNITISGFTFYSWMASLNRAAKSNVVCKLYKAGTDSFPTGAALRTDTLVIDSTFGSGQLTTLAKRANFDSAITLNFNYVLVVENLDTSAIAVVSNSWVNGDGDGEDLAILKIGANYFNSRNINVGGLPFDADFLFHPHVSYEINNNITVKDQCYKIGDSVKFTNGYLSTVISSRFYNRFVAAGLTRNSFIWEYDTVGTLAYSSINGAAKYPLVKNYDMRLQSAVLHFSAALGFCIDTFEINMKYRPTAPLPTGNRNICYNDSVTLNIAQVATEEYKWYEHPLDTVAKFTGKTYKDYNMTQNDTLFVSAENGECKTGKNQIVIVVNPNLVADKTINDSICIGGSAKVEIQTAAQTVKWFANNSSTVVLSTGKSYTSGPFTTNGSLYAELSSGLCINTTRVKADIFVDNKYAPVATIISNDSSVCLGSTGSLSLIATSKKGNVSWYDAKVNGTLLKSGNTYLFAPSQRKTYTLYAEAFDGTCAAARDSIKITVDDFPIPSPIGAISVCKGADTSVTAVLPFGNIAWYTNTAGNAVSTTPKYNLVNVAQNITLYYKTNDKGCVSPNFTPVFVNVVVVPSPTLMANNVFCAGTSGTFIAKSSGNGQTKWFGDNTGPIIFGGDTFKTPVLNMGRDYYYATSLNGCLSNKEKMRVTVNPKPDASFVSTNFNKEITLTANSLGLSSYNWKLGDGTTNANASFKHTYTKDSVYKVQLIVKNNFGCADTQTKDIVIKTSSIDALNNIGALVYPNPVANGIIWIESPKEINQVVILGMDGRTHYKSTTIAETSFSLDLTLSKGIYIMVLNAKDGGSQHTKLTID